MGSIVDMNSVGKSIKIRVHLERRSDGGLRAWSDDVPGFVLSHKNSKSLIDDVPIALAGILSYTLSASVNVELLVDFKNISDSSVEDMSAKANVHQIQEYVARCA